MQHKKHLCYLSKRMVSMSLAVVMILSTILTGCGASITTHALEDDHDHETSETVSDETAVGVPTPVSDETVSVREMISENLDDSLAEQAAEVSADYWENEVPADGDEALLGMAEQMTGLTVDNETGSSVDLNKVKTETTEKKYDENGLRQTTQYVEVNYTTVNKDALTVSSLTDLFAKNPEAYISDCEMRQPIYEVQGYKDAYVAFVDPTSVNGIEGELIQYTFVSGTVVNPLNENDRITYDEENGVVYIPKSLFFTGEGEEYPYGLVMQLMVAVDMDKTETDAYGNVLANVSVEVENNRETDVNISDGIYSMIGFEYVILDITDPEHADDFSVNDFSVYLHGSNEPLDNDRQLSWNTETGNLTVKSQAMVTPSVKVVIEKQGFLDKLSNLFGLERISASAGLVEDLEHVDGMTPVYNVDTNKFVCPAIDLDKLHVGDIFGLGKDEHDGESNGSVAASLREAGQKYFIYTGDGQSSSARLYQYLTMNGGDGFDRDPEDDYKYKADLAAILKSLSLATVNDYMTDAVNGDAKTDWYFIMKAPYRDMENTVNPDPILLYSAYDTLEKGQMVYFGKESDWKWIDDTSKIPNEKYATFFIGRCTHRDGHLLDGSTSEGEKDTSAVDRPVDVSAKTDSPMLFAAATNPVPTPPPTPCSSCTCCTAAECGRSCTKPNCPCKKCPNCDCCTVGECPGKTCTKDKCPCSEVECSYCGKKFSGSEVNSSTNRMCKTCLALNNAILSGNIKTPTVLSVLAITDEYIIFGQTMTNNDGVENSRWHQVGTCVYKIMIESRLTVTKSATNTVNDGIKDNTCYADPKTAVYGIYSAEACGDADKVGEITANGTEEVKLRPGTYWVKELVAPVGFYIDPEPHKVELTNGDVNFEVEDEPILDPGNIMVQKALDGRTQGGVMTGNVGSLAGIEFDISYYKGEYKSIEALSGVTPDEKATFVTNSYGFVMMTSRYLKPGETWKYTDEFGMLTFPLGTVYIKEKTPIDGLKITIQKGTLYTVTDKSDKTDPTNTGSHHNTVNPYHGDTTVYVSSSQSTEAAVSYENGVWKGGVSVVKSDDGRDASNPQGDATLEGAVYTIYNKSRNSVMFGGTEIPVNDVVTTITTRYDSGSRTYIATTGNNVLEYGTYQITETTAPTGYNLANWSQTFTVDKDGQMHQFIQKDATAKPSGVNWLKRWCTDVVKKGGVTVVKADTDWARSEAEGDATLEGAVYTIYNRSRTSILYGGKEIAVGGVVTTITTRYDSATNTNVATTGNNMLPYGTYEIVETTAPTGYHLADWRQTFTIQEQDEMKNYTQNGTWCADDVYRGGVSVVKSDEDWDISDYQGDATLEGAEYTIYNRSRNNVMFEGKEIAVDGAVTTITTAYDSATGTYFASTGNSVLAYGTYEIVETKAPTGYNLADFSRTFTIREEGQMHNYTQKSAADTANGLNYMHRWCTDPVMRGTVIIGKVDRETMQYISLGAASLAGTKFDIINRSEHPVYIDGVTYAVGDVIDNVVTAEREVNGNTIIAAIKEDIPYGTYEIRETATGLGYLFDTNSRNQTITFEIRNEGEVVYLTDENEQAFANQVQREDFYFQKKANDSGEEMVKIAWTVTSVTTGETHVIVTDENGRYDSEFIDHTYNTNANDPDSPISNGAIGIDEHGHYYVADSSKLDYDAGTWFTGLKPEITQWADDGNSYTVIGGTDHVSVVNDTLRAYPYDTYVVQELASDANEEYNLVSFTITLKRYSNDPDSNGIKIDYGTVDDEHVDLYTNLGFNATGFGATAKAAPAVSDLTLTDTITYSGITAHDEYTMRGELHLLDEDGNDEGVVASSEVTFEAKASGQLKMDFHLDASAYAGKRLVATQEIWQGEALRNREDDLTNEDQMVWLSGITGTRADISYRGIDLPITVTDEIDYVNLEIGSLYMVNMTVVDQETGAPILDRDGNEVSKETMLVPGSNSGTVNVSLSFMADSSVRNTYGVVFEEITRGQVYGEHKDLNDELQTVSFHDMVDTYAVNTETLGKLLPAESGQSVYEAVSLRDMKSFKSYRLEGGVYWLDDDNNAIAFTDSEGNPITASVEDPMESETMIFDGLDTAGLENRTVIVYQTLYERQEDSDDWEIAFEHCDAEDADQMVHIPKIDTEMVAENGIHNTTADAETTLTDRVNFENLVPGEEYTVVGKLHIRADEEVEHDNIPALNEETDNTEDNTEGAAKAGRAEEKHEISEETTDETDTDDVQNPADVVTKHYAAIDMGEVEGIMAEATFVPEETNGSVDVTFTCDATGLDNQVVVAFEELYQDSHVHVIPDKWVGFFDQTAAAAAAAALDDEADDAEESEDADSQAEETTYGVRMAEHKDIADIAQSVGFANIRATTLTSEDRIHERPAKGETVLTDVVEYQALIPGMTYNVTGTLMVYGETGEAEELMTVEDTFVPETTDSAIEVVFTFDSTDLGGKTVTAFETISCDGVVVATHADLNDEAQTVRFTGVDTILTGVQEEVSLAGYTNGTFEISENAEQSPVTDVVPSEENTDVPTEDENADTPSGDTEENPDVPTEDETTVPDGSMDEVIEEINADKGSIKHVEFDVYMSEDSESGDHGQITETFDLVDAVHLHNLIPGKEYTMKGEIHVKGEDGTDTGIVLSVNELTFTPTDSDYMVVCVFHVRADGIEKADLVSFQYLYRDGYLVGVHDDIDDADQTITAEANVVEKNPCGCDEPDCAHKDEPNHCVDNPGCCDDSDCCEDCDDCKEKPAEKNPCGCDEPDCAHKDEPNHCVDNPGCCDDSDCCEDCDDCKEKPAEKNPCGCDEPDCAHKDEPNHCVDNPGCCDDSDCCKDCDDCKEKPAEKNPCGCKDPDCEHKNEKDHCKKPGCCDDSDCCKDCDDCKEKPAEKNPCGCKNPDCEHKNEKDHCKKPGCCDDSDCCKDCDDCKEKPAEKNPCGCKNPDCEHKNEKDHCKKPGCCDDSDCCKDCDDCKPADKNACGCDDPDCKHKNEKDHCKKPGCCDDSDCCKDCDDCKPADKNACGCDDPDCKHKNEKDHCKKPGCCDDSDCCKDCDDCKPADKNACGCDDPNCKHKNEKDHCKNNPGCCDDSDCCKDCDDCEAKTPVVSKTDKTPTQAQTPVERLVEIVKTGQNLFLLAGLFGLAILSGGGYFFARTEKGRKLVRKILELFRK